MCYFITSVLSSKADVAAIERFAASHKRKWRPIPNHSLQQIFRDGETYYLTTRDVCDCSTGLGALADDGRPQPDYTRKMKRFRKKGWSESRIERWLDEKQKQESHRADYLTNPPYDVVLWREFLQQVLETAVARYIGLLVHWYSGVIESERILIRDRR